MERKQLQALVGGAVAQALKDAGVPMDDDHKRRLFRVLCRSAARLALDEHGLTLTEQQPHVQGLRGPLAASMVALLLEELTESVGGGAPSRILPESALVKGPVANAPGTPPAGSLLN